MRINNINIDSNECIKLPSLSSNSTIPIEESWYKIWGSSEGEHCTAFAFDAESIYLAGITNSYGTGTPDFCIVKYDRGGELQWFDTWGGLDWDFCYDVALDTFGNIYLAGATFSYGSGFSDFCLVKFNNLGVFQWYRTWGGIDSDYCWGIAIDSNNDIYIAGYTDNYGAGSSDFCLLKYDNSGSLIWTRTWGGSDRDECKDIIIDSSGNILLGGFTNSYGAGSSDICLVRFDSSGNFISSEYWGGPERDECNCLITDSLQNIFLAGITDSYGAGERDSILLKYNNLTKNFEWYQTWGGTNYEYCNAISIDSSQNIYLAGRTYSFGAGDDDAYIIKYDDLGTQLWNLTWGGVSSESCNAINIYESEDIYIAGGTYSYGAGYSDMFLVKYVTPPLITIISPEHNQFFGHEAPEFDLTIIEDNLNTTWYTLDGGLTNYTFSGTSGTIDQSAWDAFIDGEITIRFYANDTFGNLAFEEVIIYKDKKAPQIIINSPKPNQLFGNSTFYFDLTIIEVHLNTTWYTLDGGLTNYTFLGTSGTINQLAWDDCENGTVIIRFYAKDLTEKINYSEVAILKDTSFPQIIINSPKSYQLFGETTFEFNLTIIESNINTTWYTLNDGDKNIFSGNAGTIDQVAWDSCENGTVSIKFYANNTAGNCAFEEVIVHKDIKAPEIIIHLPIQYELFGNSSIEFNLTINEGNLNTSWYTLNNGDPYFFLGTSGTISQVAWELCSNGTVSIKFYANDSLGNEKFEEVKVFKDIISPQIFINYPNPNQLCGNSTIDFDLSIIEFNLNTSWYTLNDGDPYFFLGTSGTISQAAWDLCGNGTVSIKFYISDLAGNIAYEEVIVRKETSFPKIIIISPDQNQLCGKDSIIFNLSITSINIDQTWYTLNDGEPYFFLGTSGTLDQAAWDLCGNGTVLIKFFANNTAGNIGFEEIIVFKDKLSPLISILSPKENQIFSNSTFDFMLSIIEGNLDTTWYTLDGGLTNFTFSGTTGILDQNAWGDKLEGTILLRFYANDSLGNLGYADVSIIKDTTFPLIEINYPYPFDLFGNLTFNFDLTIDEIYLNATWYTLNGGITNHTFSGTTGTIDQNAWNNCLNGTIFLRFYARDSAGHVSFDEIILRKDCINPEISIITPKEDDVFDDTTFDFDLIINEPHLNTTWYTFDGGLTIYFFSGFNGTIDQGAWDNCNYGVVHLRFYANDSLGNTAFKEVIILKLFPLTPKRAFAIIVGISNYPGTSDDLMYCRSDAITMQTMLRSQYNLIPTNIILLTDSEATRSAIFNAFTIIENQVSIEDIFLFYFSGHGGEASSSLHFICPYDSIPSNPSMFIYDLEIDNLLNQLPCSEKFVMIDACNSGGFIPEVQEGNRFIMTACQADQLSWETSELSHGVFTFFFLDSIFVAPDSNGDGVRSMEEQFTYARSETIDYMLAWGELQQPSSYDGISGQAVLFPSIGSLSLVPIGNELHYSFYLYGHGFLRCLNISVCSVYQNISLKIVDLRPLSPSSTGFGYYSGIIKLEENFDVSGYEIRAEIEGYSLITIVQTFGDTDNDGLYDILEIMNNIDPTLNDTDSDGLTDYDEYYGPTNPLLNDTDNDGMPDGWEVQNNLDPLVDDSNGDPDVDNLINLDEYSLGTDPQDSDSDDDLMPDGWEVQNNLDPLIDDASEDPDVDNLLNLDEYSNGTDPHDSDTDDDGMPDGWEVQNNLDPLVDDSNGDPDEDNLLNSDEYLNGTNPQNPDTDGDGWTDGDEVLVYNTDPLDPDSYPSFKDTPEVPGYKIGLMLLMISVISIAMIKKHRNSISCK